MQKHMTLLIFSFAIESLVIITIFHSLSNNSYVSLKINTLDLLFNLTIGMIG